MTTTASTFVHSPGEYLHYQVKGNGPHTAVLLHGFAASLHTWDDLFPLFPQDKFTLHLLDLKGHGGSSREASGDFSALHNARIIAAYIRTSGLGDVTVIGHSFGGLVGLLCAIDCPHVSRLILIGSPGFPQKMPPFMRLLSLPVIGPLLMSAVPAEFIARRGLELAFHRHERITGALLERYAAGYRPKGSARALAETVRHLVPPDAERLTARYSTISLPVLLLWGEHDRIVPVWQAEQLRQHLSDSRLAMIPDCGHNPHEEKPDETYRLIHIFLSEDIDTRSN